MSCPNLQEAKTRATKAEEEFADLAKKASQIELELNRATESLALNTQKVEEREKALLAAEMEVFNLNKKVQALDGTAEQLDDRILGATHRLDKASTAVDENDRMKKVLENRAGLDEERIKKLENELKNSRTQADEADKKCDEILKRLAQVLRWCRNISSKRIHLEVEGDLEKGEERAETGEMKILELEEELRKMRRDKGRDGVMILGGLRNYGGEAWKGWVGCIDGGDGLDGCGLDS